MDTSKTLNVERGQKASLSITSALVSALLEWMLIFMLFVDASLSYLITSFARYCHLQIPCLLCSRLDHVLGNERSGFYFCQNHKLKVSSLVYCQLHNNLIDVHGTCESCFFSFATVNKSNAETYRLLVAKLGAEPFYGLSQEDNTVDFSGTRKCSCCNEEWITRSCTQKLFRIKSVNSEAPEFDGSLPIKYNINEALLGYKKVNVTSDTESEAPSFDNELIREMETLDNDSLAEPQIITLASERLINPDPPVNFSLLDSFCNVESEAPLEHGLEELNWQQAAQNNDARVQSELISFDEPLPSPSINGTQYEESNETIVTRSADLEKEVEIDYVEASRDTDNELPKEVTTEISRVESDSILANDIDMDSKPTSSPRMEECLDVGDASYRLGLGTTRGRQLSGRLLEHQKSMTESTKASEELKLFLSARGIELSLNDNSPRVSAKSEDYNPKEASNSTGVQILERRISLERNESNLSADGSTASEIEGENAVDLLKRQIEHDKKMMISLYKELEEERNASAVAVNQAMAMITRLQEEKATLHMEALQCLRMMEEQAEYDDEALQKANEMLVDKEKQIQDFEAELQLYRNQSNTINCQANSKR
ncbi:hypothetical protein RD792_015843 [Penstemon davidsonii]|uniref:GTD-binding domain-containing protein n=1 Tax=Penstemon davidsonii TaxID=160366 RepID=A0ABR0CJG3_9LAMI|nr:hypothetical protein RD792_015843 [Penstemon davidsonii]